MVVQSSAKSEHIVVAGATNQAIMSDLEKNLIEFIVINNDDISTIIMVHMKVQFHSIQASRKGWIVTLVHCSLDQ